MKACLVCERRTAGDYYSGDLRVAHVDGSASDFKLFNEWALALRRRWM
jgi:hypothetical protein